MSEILPMTNNTQESERKEIVARGREIVLNAPQLFIDVDVEADGIAGYGSMLALGAQSPTGESFYSEIRPIMDEFEQDKRDFCDLHGLERERLLCEAPAAMEVMASFYHWVDSLSRSAGKPPVFTALAANFDFAFVDLYFRKHGYKNPFGFAALDLKTLAMPLSGRWDWSETSKASLPSIILPDSDFTHNALEDAQYQQHIHFGLAGLLGDRTYSTSTPSCVE